MVHIKVQSKDGVYKHFEFAGHAGYADKGQDIVCAAVSVLFINTANSIERFTDDKIKIKQKKDFIGLDISDTLSEKGQLLLDSMVFGIEEIIKQYGDTYVSLTHEEV